MISFFQFTMSYSLIMQFNCPTEKLDTLLLLKGSLLSGLIAGIIGGSTLVLLWEKWLRNLKYGMALFHILWSFTFVYFLVSICVGIYLYKNTRDISIFDPALIPQVFYEQINFSQLQGYFFWLIIVLGMLIVLLVNDKYGPGVFSAFLLGRYFHPKREQRIFMFLDLRSSTAIAEKLGEARYFNFLKHIYEVITPSILYSKGEIYQYVGDEIVISWKIDQGVENENCIKCYFEVQKALLENEHIFKVKHDIKPEFKAGLHCGYVMTGEIGVIKKDIAFSGDVLNTTSRIQAKCNELGVNILFSKDLLDQMSFEMGSLQPKEIGEIKLRGKGGNVLLFTV